ncbi:hypothetical protein EGT07_20985 [Herbaspirillum sp. HC18]|nr:hypothetical protein EGT07_20985 [Herbaspirillum sp. HC18]
MKIKPFPFKAAHYREWLPALLALALTACGGENIVSGITTETASATVRPAAGLYLIAGDINGGSTIDPAASVDAQGAAARLAAATLTKDAAGNLYFTQRRPSGYLVGGLGLTLRKISTDGMVTTLAGPKQWWGVPDSLARAEEFSDPSGIHVDAAGNITIAERGIYEVAESIPYYRGGATLRRISTAGDLSTLAGQTGDFNHMDGPGTIARFESLADIASDRAGNLYVADKNAIRRVTPQGVVSTFAIVPEDGFVINLNGLAIDMSGTIYASDTRCVIRRFAPDGSQTILAGTLNSCGYADGDGAAAKFVLPSRMAISKTGDIYVADGTTIRKVTPSGIVTTIAGTAGKTLRDPGVIGLGALPGSLYWPTGMVFVAANELAVASGGAILKVVLP